MDDENWNDLAQLGYQLDTLSRLLDLAKRYGHVQEIRRLHVEIADLQVQRDKILGVIGERSIAA